MAAQFHLVSKTDISRFNKELAELAEKGYRLHGDYQIHSLKTGFGFTKVLYVQLMVKR